LSKIDPKVFQKVNLDILHSIPKSAKVTLIDDSIGQGGFGEVYIAIIIDDISNEQKVIAKCLFKVRKMS
jgi:hypothetical protein